MDIPIPGKWQIVEFYIKKAINKVNETVDFKAIAEKYGIVNETRTCRMEIIGLGVLYLRTDGTRVDMIPPISDSKITSFIKIDEDTFIRIKKGEMTFDDAYWYGQVTVDGDFWLRDLVIFSEVFKQFSKLVIEQ